MNEGEKNKKKIYKLGDRVTFRLPIKRKYYVDILKIINDANISDKLNEEIVNALELYGKYKMYRENFIEPNINEIERSFFKVNLSNDGSTSDDNIVSDNVEEKKEDKNVNANDNVINVQEWNQNVDEESAEDELFSQEDNSKKGLYNAFKALRKTK